MFILNKYQVENFVFNIGQANLPNLVKDSKNCPFQASKVESIESTNYLNNGKKILFLYIDIIYFSMQ